MTQFLCYGILTLIIAATTVAHAEDTLLPPPRGSKLLLTAAAQGVQIYKFEKANDGYRWVFSAPEANLFDQDGRQIGSHYAGPTWQLQDGSKLVGEVVSQAAAPHQPAAPWLMLRATRHEGRGTLAAVTIVRRVDTGGGTAPIRGCDEANVAHQARMRYSARYLFYERP